MKRRAAGSKASSTTPRTRCAVYTRKSSEEGLQQDFNSLDAQREAAEAYIASQKAEGWICLAERYDDGGFTGGNMERPALQRLLADIESGQIDCVVVYKVDRLSRSLLDFARIMENFECQQVSFVSVTQHFNTTHSMGRLTLNILLSFAQFEREIIGERIRDKIAASRQRGKWTGGRPILGYDVDRSSGGPRLVINPNEASQVCQIFELYLERGSLLKVVTELEHRDWRTKVWTTRAKGERGGLPYDKCRLHSLLTNVLYVGKVRYKNETYAGEHQAIVADDLFARVQRQLQRNGRNGTVGHRNRHGALLRGLLRCRACNRVMSHTFTTRGGRRYRYYRCTNATKRGRQSCPSGSLPAIEMENAVVEQIHGIARDPGLLRETLEAARRQTDQSIGRRTAERRAVQRGLARLQADIRRVVADDAAEAAARLPDLHDQVAAAQRRLTKIETQLLELRAERVSDDDVAGAFADFDNLWSTLSPREQARVVRLLVRAVEFDADQCTIEISFHAAGIRTLADGESNDAEEAA